MSSPMHCCLLSLGYNLAKYMEIKKKKDKKNTYLSNDKIPLDMVLTFIYIHILVIYLH